MSENKPWNDMLAATFGTGSASGACQSKLNAQAQQNCFPGPATIKEALDTRISGLQADLKRWEDLRKQLEETGMLGAPYSMLQMLVRL